MSLRGKIISKFASNHCLTVMGMVFFMLVLTKPVQAQLRDTSYISLPDTTTIVGDSLKVPLDSLGTDTTVADSAKRASLEERLGIRISPDALTSIVTSESRDSAVMDMKNDLFYLYGEAKINYEDLQLTAGQVTFMQSKNTVIAQPSYDSLGNIVTKPTFTQGSEKFTYDSLQYNFKSKRAIVRNARSQYGEGFVFSEQVKRNPDQTIYGYHNIYTTCALDTPHFGIAAQKIKVIPNQVVASGPANLTIEGVPTPLFLPFGLFPISQGQRSGFRLPTYTIEENRGVGLLNGGYYFYINDYVDLLVQANLYSKGSYNIGGVTTYANRYRYNGALSFAYAHNKTGEEFERDAVTSKDFQVNWAHRKDPKSRPGTDFNASVNAGTSTYNANNTYTANQILQNQFASSITYSKNWQNKPYNLTVGARHSQNTNTRLVDVTLPEVNFNINQFNPFQGKNSTGTKWYEKISASYNMNALNQTSFYDSTFSFNTLALNDFRNGIKHTVPVGANYNILRFLNMNFNTRYTEYWLTERMYRYYNSRTDVLDTLSSRGFYTARDFDASVGFNTRIYGLKMFKRGKLAGIRHELRPNVSLNYVPDYAAAPFHYGYRTRLSANAAQPEYRSPYENSVIGAPGYGQFGDYRSYLGFGFDNNLQIKVRTDKDTAGFKNIRIIDNLSLSSGYDLARDSFNWANINTSFATNLFNNLLNIQGSASFDPYVYDTTQGRRINTTLYDAGKGIARFTSANLSVGGSFRSKAVDDNSDKPETKTDEYRRIMQYGAYNDYVDFNIPWTLNFTYSLSATRNEQRDSIMLDHYTGFGVDFNITPRWKLVVNSGYNFTQKKLQITDINIYRDLHCWEMRLWTVPFGPNKSYNFTLNVKATILQDLKLMRRRDYRDAIGQ